MGGVIHRPLLKMVCDRIIGWNVCGARVLRFEIGDQMIERILSPFDWVLALPIETQFHVAAIGSFTGFVFSAIVRESTKDKAMRMSARAVGLGAFIAMICYASYATNEVKMLASELMVKRGQDATSIADQPAVVVAEKVVEIATPSGTKVSWTEFSGGRLGPLSVTTGRFGRGGDTGGFSAGGVDRENDGVDAMSNGKHVAF